MKRKRRKELNTLLAHTTMVPVGGAEWMGGLSADSLSKVDAGARASSEPHTKKTEPFCVCMLSKNGTDINTINYCVHIQQENAVAFGQYMLPKINAHTHTLTHSHYLKV